MNGSLDMANEYRKKLIEQSTSSSALWAPDFVPLYPWLVESTKLATAGKKGLRETDEAKCHKFFHKSSGRCAPNNPAFNAALSRGR
jgi:hypothetical protein